MNRIILSRVDLARIKKCIADAKQQKTLSGTEAENLLHELESARIVEPEEIPADVVTMNSIVKVSFKNTSKMVEFQIVYPDQANVKDRKISIFSPVATALIGYKVNDEVEWIVPGGLTTIRIEEILYQPEAAGEFDL